MAHRNARLTLRGRLLVQRVVDEGRPVAHHRQGAADGRWRPCYPAFRSGSLDVVGLGVAVLLTQIRINDLRERYDDRVGDPGCQRRHRHATTTSRVSATRGYGPTAPEYPHGDPGVTRSFRGEAASFSAV